MAAEIPHSDLLFDFLYVHENETKVLTIKILKEQKRRKGFPDLTED